MSGTLFYFRYSTERYTVQQNVTGSNRDGGLMVTKKHRVKTKRRGRPTKGPLESLKVKLWFWAVAGRLGVTTGYAMEKYFSPETVRQGPNGGTIRSCKFDKYKRGEHVPEPELVDRIESEFPGTKKFLNHPFWIIAKTPITDIEEFYIQLSNLRPEISKLLFFSPIDKVRMPIRQLTGPFGTIEDLIKESDWDALTACIGLIQEANYLGGIQKYYLKHYTRRTYGVFLPVISQHPFTQIAHELFDYLREHFLDRPEDAEWTKKLDSTYLDGHIYVYQTMLLIIEDLGILKHHFLAPPSCLYLAERYLKVSVIEKIHELSLSGKYHEATKLPEIKKLTRSLRRWEKKKVAEEHTVTS